MNIAYAKGPIRLVDDGGAAVHHPPGSHWPADDPYVLQHPDMFSDDPRYYLSFSQAQPWYLDPDVDEPPTGEQATAVPGEKRNTRRS